MTFTCSFPCLLNTQPRPCQSPILKVKKPKAHHAKQLGVSPSSRVSGVVWTKKVDRSPPHHKNVWKRGWGDVILVAGWTWLLALSVCLVKAPCSCLVSGAGLGRVLLVSDGGPCAKFREKDYSLEGCFPAHNPPPPAAPTMRQ